MGQQETANYTSSTVILSGCTSNGSLPSVDVRRVVTFVSGVLVGAAAVCALLPIQTSGFHAANGFQQLMDYVQFTALIGFVLVDGQSKNTLLLDYFSGQAWTLGFFRPFSKLLFQNRQLLELKIQDEFFGVSTQEVFPNILSVFSILGAFLVVVYFPLCVGFLRCLSKCRKRNYSREQILKHWKLVMGLEMRLFQVSISGLALASSLELTLTTPQTWWKVVASLVLLLICSLLCLVANKIRKFDRRDLEAQRIKLVYGSFYLDFKYERRLFFVANNAHKFISSMIIGSLAGHSWAQASSTLALRFIFSTFLMKMSPYQDQYQQKISNVVGSLKVVQLCTLMLFIGDVWTSGFQFF
eukprot:TRINITY_DN4348_c0_g1_i1.p1 TRINITY_DN4348_c0_g1~~TRINITY_DN4348_c0_g1_i1.p1  ORF type:complete len:355 (-),score=72.27 TRINITY_DN4348_c0_g1_i1:7-1071(-)